MRNDSHIVDQKHLLKLDLQLFAEDEVNEDNTDDVLSMFGVESEESEDIENDMEEDANEDQEDEQEDEEQSTEEEPPATEGKKVKVKFNKQEVEVDVNDENLPEYVQKALALDRERERRSEYEKALDRAAKLHGYKDHADFVANLDRIEQASIQKQQDDYEAMRNHLLDELEQNGVDRQQAEQYLENHPLLQQARQAIEEKQRLQQEREEVTKRERELQGWEALLKKYPHLGEQMDEQGNAPWLNADMVARIQRGYDPIDAYELAHRDVLFTQTKKQTEQAVIKQQRLNKRSQVADSGVPQTEPEVPAELAWTFSAFGLSPKQAKKYVKK